MSATAQVINTKSTIRDMDSQHIGNIVDEENAAKVRLGTVLHEKVTPDLPRRLKLMLSTQEESRPLPILAMADLNLASMTGSSMVYTTTSSPLARALKLLAIPLARASNMLAIDCGTARSTWHLCSR
jgi:hypothetical protein